MTVQRVKVLLAECPNGTGHSPLADALRRNPKIELVDVVTDGKTAYRVHNGHSMMRSVTGTGCQMSALIGAYAAANTEKLLQSVLAGVCGFGLCGELAYQRLSVLDGNASYRNYIIDAVYHLTGEALEKGARYEIC